MGGTKAGWAKTRASLIEYYGSEEAFHESRKKIGSIGGKLSRGGGFTRTGDPELDATRHLQAVEAGRIGGKVRRRRRW